MDFLAQHAGPLAASVLYAVVGAVTLCGLFWVVELILPFSIRKEIEDDHNTALGVILAGFLIALSIIVAAAIGG
ncbi:MAG: DUF350 domain-containing protein [Acidobacteriota bacterium]